MRQSASLLDRSRAMTTLSQDISPLRQRMMDDMRMRRLAPTTQANYLRVVREFSLFLGRSPDTASVEDLRRYQLYLVDRRSVASFSERRDHRAEVLFRHDARSRGVNGEDASNLSAAHLARHTQPRRSGSTDRGSH